MTDKPNILKERGTLFLSPLPQITKTRVTNPPHVRRYV